MWDLCCDHGYVGLKAYHSGTFPEIHFVDQVPEIISSLQERFENRHQRPGLTEKVNFWAQSGETLTVPMEGTAVIAGVGAHTILQILRGLCERDENLKISRWILGPHTDEEFLQESLSVWPRFSKVFQLAALTNVREGQRDRKLLIFDKVL